MSAIIQLKDLVFRYDETTILERLNLTIQKGDFIGIIGPNGGGKTTLLKLIMGFLEPTSGEIRVFDRNPRESLNKIAYVPQTLRFDPLFPIPVMDVVLTGRLRDLPWHGRYSKEDRLIAEESLEKVGMADFATRQFGKLSTGQAQRVLIARALASKPELLLLDEPTACVDVQSESAIQKILQELPDKMTILMVTHDLPTIINDVQKVLTVHGTVSLLEPKDVCDHFSMGVYHSHSHEEKR